MMKTTRDLTGLAFGKVTVERRHGHRDAWTCKCECGRTKTFRGYDLSAGRVTSCGCQQRHRLAGCVRTHGRHGTPEYRAWRAMIERCHRPESVSYANYGGRGITVCDEWRYSFATFLRDVGDKPSPKHSLDRKNNNGNYEPSNVRWATKVEQMRNTRRSRRLTACGMTMTISEWSERRGIPRNRIASRLARGASDEEAVQ